MVKQCILCSATVTKYDLCKEHRAMYALSDDRKTIYRIGKGYETPEKRLEVLGEHKGDMFLYGYIAAPDGVTPARVYISRIPASISRVGIHSVQVQNLSGTLAYLRAENAPQPLIERLNALHDKAQGNETR